MFQNKMTQKFFAAGIIALTCLSFSCSPKAAGVRAQIKTGQQSLDANVTALSQQQALVQGTNYTINSISLPSAVAGGQEVSIELKTPDNQYLPVTTKHLNGVLDTQGTYNDTARAQQVNIQARCTAGDCSKYTLLVTVVKNGTKLFQAGAISYKSDCKFFSISIGYNVAQIQSSLTAFEATYNPTPSNDATEDGESCQ
ncbi:MAG: hypothetical protein H7328_08570 [Bdellovibrio sp.]|nr:hypothetical protein [Bdellovibrio sp.]